MGKSEIHSLFRSIPVILTIILAYCYYYLRLFREL